MKRKSFKNWDNIKRKWEATNIRQKREVSDQNGRVGISGISQRMTLCMLPKTKTVGADLQSTALQSTDDGNNDYQWLPAEFRNCFSFGNVCWHRPGSHSMWVTAGLGFSPWSKLMLRMVFHPAVVPQPLFRQNLLMLKLMWQFVLNRVWQIVRCMFMSGSSNREAAVLEDIIITGKGWQ